MEQCASCGAAIAAEAAWCGQCFMPRGTAAVAPAPGGRDLSIMSGTRREASGRPALPMVKTRWRKTPTTFGPAGRLICTFLLLIPLPPMIIGTVVGIIPCLIGVGIWLLVIMPWALRDIWKAGQLPAG